MLGQDQGNTRPKTVFTPQSPTFERDKMDYSKSYHLAKEEESNIDGNFEKNIYLSEHISEKLRRMAMLERKHRSNREGSHSGSSDYAVSMSSLIENRLLNQTQQIGQFMHRIGNQNYHKNEIVE